jgi:hypothetical protein
MEIRIQGFKGRFIWFRGFMEFVLGFKDSRDGLYGLGGLESL